MQYVQELRSTATRVARLFELLQSLILTGETLTPTIAAAEYRLVQRSRNRPPSEATMPEAYGDAALRHWSDAVFLESDKRLPNADQLFGIAAECAIKAAVAQIPSCAAGGVLTKRYREHVEILWDRVPLQDVHKRFPGLVALLKAGRPFADWGIEHRYEPDSATHPAAMLRHCEAAKRVLGAVSLLGRRRS